MDSVAKDLTLKTQYHLRPEGMKYALIQHKGQFHAKKTLRKPLF